MCKTGPIILHLKKYLLPFWTWPIKYGKCLFASRDVLPQNSVHIRTEEGTSLKLQPEPRYSADFEPYESISMEVEDSFMLCVTEREAVCLSPCPCVGVATYPLLPLCQGAGDSCKVSRALGSRSESCLTQAEPDHSERVLLNMDQVKVSDI